MTKKDPDKLCSNCLEFDYIMNRKGGSSCDMLVVCDHEENEDLSEKLCEIEERNGI